MHNQIMAFLRAGIVDVKFAKKSDTKQQQGLI